MIFNFKYIQNKRLRFVAVSAILSFAGAAGCQSGSSSVSGADSADSSGASGESGTDALLNDTSGSANKSLEETSLDVLRWVLDGSSRTLSELNLGLSSGTLSSQQIECLGGAWPSTSYFCDDFGGFQSAPPSVESPSVVAFSYGNDQACIDNLVRAETAVACVPEYVEIVAPSGQTATYRLSAVEGRFAGILDVSGNESAQSTFDPTLAVDVCSVIFLDTSVESYSDQGLCDSLVRDFFDENV